MIDTPRILQTTDQHIAVIRFLINKDEIQKVMGPGIEELMAVTAEQGIGPAGPWLSHHFRIDPEFWDFEIAVPVLAPVVATGRVQPGRLMAARVLRTTYRGGYEGLGAAWNEFDAWIAANAFTKAGDLWEVYRVGPETTIDSTKWETELNRPLAV